MNGEILTAHCFFCSSRSDRTKRSYFSPFTVHRYQLGRNGADGGGIRVKVAVTVQLAVIGLVVKMLSERAPPQVPPTEGV